MVLFRSNRKERNQERKHRRMERRGSSAYGSSSSYREYKADRYHRKRNYGLDSHNE